MLSASIVLPTRNVAYAMAFDRSFPQSLASLYIADSEHFLAEAPLLSASVKKRFGIRVERLPPPSPLSLSPTPLLRHGVGPLSLRLRQQTLFDGYVLAFAATPPLSGRWHASTPLSTRNLRLLFRVVDDGLRHSLLHFAPEPY